MQYQSFEKFSILFTSWCNIMLNSAFSLFDTIGSILLQTITTLLSS